MPRHRTLADTHQIAVPAIPGHAVQQPPQQPGPVRRRQVLVQQRFQRIEQHYAAPRLETAAQIEQCADLLITGEGAANLDALQQRPRRHATPPRLHAQPVDVEEAPAVQHHRPRALQRQPCPPHQQPMRQRQHAAVSQQHLHAAAARGTLRRRHGAAGSGAGLPPSLWLHRLWLHRLWAQVFGCIAGRIVFFHAIGYISFIAHRRSLLFLLRLTDV